MISKLFPRILNKSSDKTAVKSSEFSDALNILVTGDDGGDSNIIKKADGNIAAVINDPKNFPILGNSGVIKETVLGKYEDEEKNRVYYFTFGEEDGGTGLTYSSIYLLERITQSDYKFILLLRTNSTDDPSVHLGFTRDDFVPANIIETPKLKKDFALDSLNSGSTGDTESDFDLDDIGDESPTVAISLVGETLFISGDPGGDFGEVFDDADLATPLTTEFGYFIVQNSGNVSGDVAISAQVTNSVNGASVDVPATVTVVGGFQLQVNFGIVLDVAEFQNNGGIVGPDGVDVQVAITIQEVVTENATSLTNYNETFTSEVTFMFPPTLLPVSLDIRGNLATDAVNFPSNSSTATSIPESFFIPNGTGIFTEFMQFPDNQFATLIGPFSIKFDEWEESPPGSVVNLYSDARVTISFEASAEDEQGQPDFFEIIDADDLNAINNTSTSIGTTELTFTRPGGVSASADDVFGSFYVRKAFDTSTWLDDGFNEIAFSKLRAFIEKKNSNGSYVGHEVVSPSQNIALSQGVGAGGARANHEIGFFGQVIDAPDPANIQVTNVSWGTNQAVFDLEPNVDDGTSANTGSSVTQTITVENLGNIGGWYYPTCFFGQKSWSGAVEAAGNLADAQAANYLGYSAWDVFRGSYEMVDITYTSPSDSNQVKPWSPELFNSQDPSWIFTDNTAGVFGSQSFDTDPPPAILLEGGEIGTITITWSNTASDFEYGAIGPSDFSDFEDDEITDTYEGTSGPYYYYGQPDTNTGVSSNSSFYPAGLPNFEVFVWDVYVKNDPAPPNALNQFSPVWGFSVGSSNGLTYVVVDGNFEGPLAINAHKTTRFDPYVTSPATGLPHPLVSNTTMTSAWQGGAPNSAVSWSGSNYAGTRPFFLGLYPDTAPVAGSQGSFYSMNAESSGAGVDGFDATPQFWFKGDASWYQAKADFLFINTTTSAAASDINLEVLMEPFEAWFYQTSSSNVSQSLPQGLEVTQEFGLDAPSQQVHQPTPTIGGFAQNFDPIPDGLGSLGPSMVFSNPIPIDSWNGEPAQVFLPNGQSYNSWGQKQDGTTSYNFPPFDTGLGSTQLSFPFYLGTFRRNSINIPPGHLVVGRVQFNYQTKGSQNPQLGMEDIVNQPGVDYDDPYNVYGMPCTIRAKWSGGSTNNQSNYVTIGNVIGVATLQQLNTLTNY